MTEKDILKQLFNGRVYPSENIGVNNSALHKANAIAEDAKVNFSKKITECDRAEFNEIFDLYYNAFRIYHYECFSHGFKLGVTLMHEALRDSDTLTRHSSR